MEGWQLDRVVNIEGLATALAALGAALAYVIDLASRRRNERRQRAYQARGRLILELAQIHFRHGVTEEDVLHCLTSDDHDPARLRSQYGVPKAARSKQFDGEVERQLIGLVFDRLLEIDAPNRYRLEGSDRWLRRQPSIRILAEQGYDGELRQRIVDELWKMVEQGDAWSVQRGLESLTTVGEDVGSDRLIQLLDSASEERREKVAEGVARFVGERW